MNPSATVLVGDTLPQGWTAEWDGADAIVISAPTFGAVTVDLKCRGYRGGWTKIGRLASQGTYVGRGWRRALFSDAVDYLAAPPRRPRR